MGAKEEGVVTEGAVCGEEARDLETLRASDFPLDSLPSRATLGAILDGWLSGLVDYADYAVAYGELSDEEGAALKRQLGRELDRIVPAEARGMRLSEFAGRADPYFSVGFTRTDVELMAGHYGVGADDLEARFCDSAQMELCSDKYISDGWDVMEDLARCVAREQGVDTELVEPFDFDAAWYAQREPVRAAAAPPRVLGAALPHGPGIAEAARDLRDALAPYMLSDEARRAAVRTVPNGGADDGARHAGARKA